MKEKGVRCDCHPSPWVQRPGSAWSRARLGSRSSSGPQGALERALSTSADPLACAAPPGRENRRASDVLVLSQKCAGPALVFAGPAVRGRWPVLAGGGACGLAFCM